MTAIELFRVLQAPRIGRYAERHFPRYSAALELTDA
jgi:hypothetical protein